MENKIGKTKRSIDKFSVVYYVLVLLVICNLISYIIGQNIKIENEETEALIGSLMNFVAYLTIIPIIVVNRDSLKKAYVEVRKSNLLKFILIILLGYVTLTVCNAISTTIISNIIDSSNANQASLDNSANGGILAILVIVPTMVILGPVVEELVFRKAVFNLIGNKKIAIAVSLIGFGLIHVLHSLVSGDFPAMIYMFQYALMGSVMVFLYLRNNKNIAYPLTLHIFNNSITAIAIIIAFINK